MITRKTPNLIIGSRGSKLALWQATQVRTALERLHPELAIEIEVIKTTGDKLTEASLVQIGGKGVFTKEIEDALLARRIDLAVHSLKDLPTTLPEGLHIAAITEREDVRDALVAHPKLARRVKTLHQLPQGARVGTSSLRRAAQLRHARPDLQISELRGNVETRLRRLAQGRYDAVILATAGLLRLGFADKITERIPVNVLLPAVGQGALAIETRINDDRANYLLESLNHWPTRYATQGERALLRGLGGGCAVPVAAYGYLGGLDDEAGERSYVLEALVIDVEGRESIYDMIVGTPYKSEEMGELLAARMLAKGARSILERIAPKPAPTTTDVDDQEPEATIETDAAEIFSEPEAAQTAVQPELNFSATPQPVEQTPESADSFTADTDQSRVTAGSESQSELPLAGRRVIVTRAVRQAGELTRQLESNGAEVILCPTIEIRDPSSWESLDRALGRLAQYHWLAFTSTNGVDYFLRRADELNIERAELSSLKICAVGRKTAERLMDEGLNVELTPARFTADNLVEAFARRYGTDANLKGSRMLLPASRTTRDVIRPALTQLGVSVDVVEAYQTVLPEKTDDLRRLFNHTPADYLIFTSPSTVANLATLLETDNLARWLSRTRIACIGPVTTESAELHGLTVHVQPEEHTSRGLVRALLEDNGSSQTAGRS
jgi:hydroxymethylbilane synthase